MSNGFKTLFVAVAALTAAGLASPQKAAAQEDCGLWCIPCDPAWEYFQGEAGLGSGPFWVNFCGYGGCAGCGPNSLNNDAHAASTVASKFESATVDGLADLYSQYADRVLINPERGMIVVQGGCVGDALVGVAFLRDEAIQHLAVLGVRSLSDHLAEEEQLRALLQFGPSEMPAVPGA